MNKKVLWLLLFPLLIGISGVFPFTADAATTTYDFNSDTVGQTPANTTVTSGTFGVANQSTLGNSLHALTVPGTSGTSQDTAGILLDNFASTTDYSVTWKEAYESNGARHGVILRTQPTDSQLIGIRQGYLFQVNHPGGTNPNTVKIYRMGSTLTQIMTAALTSATPRWFKAIVSGTSLGFYYSNDGTTFTATAATTTDSTYASGGVQYTAGFGRPVTNDYIDDIVQVTNSVDTTAPVISSIASSTTATSATLTWTTDEVSDSRVDFGTTSSYGTASTSAALTTSHSITLTGLSSNTLYHFRVQSTDGSTNVATSTDRTFTTAAVVDTTSPVISSIATSTTATTATITWTTNESSDSTVNYGTTSSYGSASTTATLATSHSITLTGLTANTLYHFQVQSTDASNNTATSTDQTVTTPTVTPTIIVTSPKAYQVIQRNGSNVASIAITGTYTGSPASIEASWNGGAYTTIVASPTGGTFSGTLTNQTAGQGTLSVRFTDNTAIVATKTFVGVGDVYVIAGQSNFSGRGFSNQTYTSPGSGVKATLFGNDDTWKELVDPIDSATGQVDSVSSDSGSAAGSVFPLLATYILADQNVPVAFIPTAKGGVAASSWLPNANHKLASTLFGSMERRIDAAANGSVKAVLWFQGETDAQNCVTYSTYTTNMNTIVNTIATDYPGTKTLIGQIGQDTYTDSCTDAIRKAQTDLVTSNTNTLAGAITYDVKLSDESGDTLHFKSNGDLSVFAQRWWNAIRRTLYGSAVLGSPKVSSITYNSLTNVVDILFDTALASSTAQSFTNNLAGATTLPTSSAFSLSTTGGTPTISGTSLPSNQTLRLTLSGATATTLSVTYASGSSAVNNAIYSTSGMPALPFFNQSAGLADITAPAISSIATSTTATTATITWTTDESSDSTISYGTTSSYGSASTTAALTTSHSIILTGLSSNTEYHFQVQSMDASSNTATSTDQTFTTAIESVGQELPSHHHSSGPSLSEQAEAAEAAEQAALTDTLKKLVLQLEALGVPVAPDLLSLLGIEPASTHAFVFTRDLSLGSTGTDVQALQEFLNRNGFTIASTGAGAPGQESLYFGALTEAALIQFQNAHAAQILTPLGLTKGTGYFGRSTRTYVNAHI